jgi:hypothetical protein
MKVGDLVKTTNHKNARAYPGGLGIVTSDMGSLTCGPNDIVYVLWPDAGQESPVRIMLLELISESR